MLSITYVDSKNKTSKRIIEAQYLLLAWPFWYVLAWDKSREDVRTFRLDRIVEAQRLNHRFQLRKADLFWAVCDETSVVL